MEMKTDNHANYNFIQDTTVNKDKMEMKPDSHANYNLIQDTTVNEDKMEMKFQLIIS
jgi:hypothetical protein